MDQDEIMAITFISIIPICGICCFLAYFNENFCKKRNILEESKVNVENNYNEIV